MKKLNAMNSHCAANSYKGFWIFIILETGELKRKLEASVIIWFYNLRKNAVAYHVFLFYQFENLIVPWVIKDKIKINWYKNHLL
jgi:hypothetical protein